MKGLSLFAGVGLFDRGMENAGYEITEAVEIDPKAVETYNKNNKLQIVPTDIKNYSAIGKEFDFVIGGFPCPSFSVASGQGKGLADPRGQLFFELVRIINEAKPKFFLLENVRNILSVNNGQDWAVIKKELESLGYFIHHSVLSPHTHGNIPALRERVFIVGLKDNKPFQFPQPIPLTRTPFDLLDLTMKAEERFYIHSGQATYQRAYPAVSGKVYQLRRTCLRQNKRNLIPTITIQDKIVIRDWWGVRKLTPKELFMFQGANNFIVPSAITTGYTQVGNAVCVSVVERIIPITYWNNLTERTEIPIETP